VIAYFDTSALIKLVVAEDGAEQSRRLWDAASEVVISRLAWTEALAVLAAARRGQRLTDSRHAGAVRAMRRCVAACTIVSVADDLVDQAAELAARYELRAADAIQLATALAVLDADSVLVTWDKRLRQAGLQAGLVTAPAGS
jgi:predicted nucleic acid-binding protein